MKHIGSEIDKILRSRKIVKREFAEQLQMTDVNLSRLLKKPSIDAALLSKIAGLLCVPVSCFFNEEIEFTANKFGHNVIGKGNQVGDNSSFSDCQGKLEKAQAELDKARIEINFLRKEVNDKNSLIAEKERYISLLLQQQKHD